MTEQPASSRIRWSGRTAHQIEAQPAMNILQTEWLEGDRFRSCPSPEPTFPHSSPCHSHAPQSPMNRPLFLAATSTLMAAASSDPCKWHFHERLEYETRNEICVQILLQRDIVHQTFIQTVFLNIQIVLRVFRFIHERNETFITINGISEYFAQRHDNLRNSPIFLISIH